MPLLTIVLVLIVVGVLLYFINTYIPMDGTIKKVITFLIVFVVILWLLQVFGVLTGLGTVRIGR